MIRVNIKMIQEWLQKNGYDGLYNHEKECSCSITDPLACADNNCVAAEKVECDCDKKCPFHLSPAEEEPTKKIH